MYHHIIYHHHIVPLILKSYHPLHCDKTSFLQKQQLLLTPLASFHTHLENSVSDEEIISELSHEDSEEI